MSIFFEMHVFERKLENEEGVFQSCQSVPGMCSRMVDHQFYSGFLWSLFVQTWSIFNLIVKDFEINIKVN